MKILLGADPEVFYKEDNKFVSAFGVIEGNKANPKLVDNGAVQVDGMALEFNIDPAATEEDWMFNIHSVMAQLRDMVSGEIEATPIAEFGLDYINKQPREAKELGCDPDFNAWTGKENPKPDEDLPFRTGAGHIHIGFTEGEDINDALHRSTCCDIVKQLDFYLGLPSLLMDPCTKRREMYGKAGAYRPKTYGLEYRVLSNFWLQSDEYIKWAYTTVHQALNDYMNSGSIADRYEDIQDTINTSDKVRALDIINAEGWEVPNVP